MGKKLRQGKPWMPGFRYSALLTTVSLNLMVTDIEKSVKFYQIVLGAEVHYWDVDFAAMRVSSIEVMLHADHTHTEHEWYDRLASGVERGVGAQIRLLGLDPDVAVERARQAGGQVIAESADKGHGWREAYIRDRDGYEWAVGVLIPPAVGPLRPSED